MIRKPLGIACALVLLAGAPSGDAGPLSRGGDGPAGRYHDAGCSNPALSVPLVTAVAVDGLATAQAAMVVSAAGLVLTQWSSVRDAQRILITLPGHRLIPARPLGVSEARDLVLLKFTSPVHLCPISFGDVSHIAVAQSVRIYGYPFADSLRSEFVISETGRITAIQGSPVRALRSDAVVGSGFAGSPVTDTHGKVIGVQRINGRGTWRDVWVDSALGMPALIEQLRQSPPTRLVGSALPLPAIARRPPTDRTIKIAVHVSLSGPKAVIGHAILDGASQAVAELKAAFQAHGIRLLLVPLDDRGDLATAVANARKHLLDDPSVLLVIGHNSSGVCQGAARVYEQAALPMITPACEVAPLTDAGVRTFFRVIGRDDVQGAVAAQFAHTALRARTAYVAYDPVNYGLRTAAAFWWEGRHLGLRMAGPAPVDTGTLKAAAANMKPDVVYYGGEAGGAARFLKTLRSLGVRAPFLGPDGLDSSEFAYLAGPAAAGTIYTVLNGPPGFYQGAESFTERFRARAGREPGPFDTLGYDAACIGLEAVVRASMGYRRLPTRGDVLGALHDSFLVFHGATGTIRFMTNGDRLGGPVFVMQVRGPTWANWKDNMLLATITP